MSAIKVFLGFGTVLLLFVFMSIGVVSAHDIRTGDNIVTAQNEVIDETLFAFGKTLDISSEVNGDIFCAGQTINVSGDVHGDVICAGQTINISGNVDGDIRLGGQTVNVSGRVDGNASIVSQTFTLQPSGEITGDLSTGAEDVSLSGPVGRDVAVAGSNVIIANTVGRNVLGSLESLELTSTAVVEGNIEYTSQNELVIDSGAVVSGSIDRNIPESNSSNSSSIFGWAIAWVIYIFLAMLVTSLVLALLIPGVLKSTTDKIIKSPWKALLIGFLASLVAPLILIILGVTVIGIPLMILFGLIWIVIVMLSGPFTAFYLGRLLLSKSGAFLTMLVGSVVLLVIYFIPIIGIFALIAAYWLGTGMILLELSKRTPEQLVEATEDASPKKSKKSTKKKKD